MRLTIDCRAVETRGMSREHRDALAVELVGRAVARASEEKWWKALKNLARLGAVVFLASGCASAPPVPQTLGGDAFSFTPEQCLMLSEKQRTYKATQETATYASGLGAVLTGVFLAAFHGKDGAEVVAPALSTSATAVAAGVGVFAGSQAKSLEGTLSAGSCPR